MSASPRPARFGPFHRRTQHDPSENGKVSSSGLVWGRRPRNVYAGLRPAVKAWLGTLPRGIVGFEFYTDVEPDPGRVPEWPCWSDGRAGVISLEKNELVAISVIVTKRQDPE